MDEREFTYDIIREDGGFRKALIRFANDSDDTGDKFDTLQQARKSINNFLSSEVYVSSEILNSLF